MSQDSTVDSSEEIIICCVWSVQKGQIDYILI